MTSLGASPRRVEVYTTSSYGRVTKRSPNACKRCRRQKIKCSGVYPCETCTKKKLSCDFDDQDQKVLVTRGYLNSLQKRIASLEDRAWSDEYGFVPADGIKEQNTTPKTQIHVAGSSPGSLGQPRPQGDPTEDHPQVDTCNGESGPSPVDSITNPLSTGPSSFIVSDTGKLFYLGTSSNWSFTRQISMMTYHHVHQAPMPCASLLFDCETYSLEPIKPHSQPHPNESPDSHALPTIDYTLHLVSTVKFHCGQLFHLYEEHDFMAQLYEFYSLPEPRAPRSKLWFVHLLLIIAFGKAFVQRPNLNESRLPPGAAFFARALDLLPKVGILGTEPEEATEVLCCVSLYLHCIDHRTEAYNYIGQAVRIAMTQGLHMDAPELHLGEALSQRRRKVWWTAFVLDREMTSLMGLPQSVCDTDVHTLLPIFASDDSRTKAFSMRTKLSYFIASINRSIYGPDGRLDGQFLAKVRDALAGIAGLTDELHQEFPLALDRNSSSGMSRLSAHLHLTYHQCIVLATRPLLFFFFRVRLQSLAPCVSLLDSSPTVKNLVQMCLESSQQTIVILECLQGEGLLETFLSFDLDALFISTTSVLTAPTLHPQFQKGASAWRQAAFALFNEITRSGNLVAKLEQSELVQLSEMLDTLARSEESNGGGSLQTPSSPGEAPGVVVAPYGMLPGGDLSQQGMDTIHVAGGMDDENMFSTGLSAAQIMDMVNAIEDDQNDWMSEALHVHGG